MDNDSIENEADWEIIADGLYMATRSFLIRRGYCCANQCRNCPYIDWRNNPTWQPGPHTYVRSMHVSPRAVAGAQTLLAYHIEYRREGTSEEQEKHQRMIEHYRFLLKQWKL